ncbi:MAG: methyltransferase domain-containing protein [Candidatus Margulisbacteria bacterium]|nr:methyltransferase domain-containing protein [Candidatus Margulisiibacteriota bacterium]
MDAKSYEAWYQTPKGTFADVLEKGVIADLCQVKPGDRVLEIGCGTGHFSAYFEELGAQVTGLDTSPEMLKLAKNLPGDLKIDFTRGDAYRLPFADNSFDLVAMITTLEFFSSPKRALKEAFRVSKGKVFLGILNRNSLLARKRMKSEKKVWKEAHFYTFKEVLGLLGQDKKIRWKGVIYLPLLNSGFAFGIRLMLEKLLSALKLPGGAFVGILAARENDENLS